MSLTPGQKLAHFEILDFVGAGAMGRVYRALDTTLGRPVALKVLPPELDADDELVARFELEARVLAAINHPSIAAIHGRHRANGLSFLTLEFVDGQTLHERLAAGPLSAAEAAEVGRQLAGGLEAAHEAGVIHRDLKPGNVRITPEGTVKILDLGLGKFTASLARADRPGAGADPDLSTRAGQVMGTPAYMSPEQARSQHVDRRADIWAFGCILFECLTGKRPFAGDSMFDLLLAIVEEEPDWSALPPDLAPELRSLVERCLVKDPARRLRDIGEARIVLDDLVAGRTPRAVTGPPRGRHRRGSRAAAVGLLLVAGFAGWSLSGTPSSGVERFEIVAWDSSWNAPLQPAVSPDGTTVAYVSDDRLWVCSLADSRSRELLRAADVGHPFWSPDSAWVGFVSGRRLLRVPVGGGDPVEIAVLASEPLEAGGFAWSDDDRIRFATGDSDLLEIPAAGGAVRRLLAVDPETESDLHGPTLLPDRQGLLFTVHPRDPETRPIDALRGKERRRVRTEPGEHLEEAVVSPRGYLLFTRARNNRGLFAAPFSPSDLRVAGPAFLVAQHARSPSLSEDGTLVFERHVGPDRNLVWIDESGAVLGRQTPVRDVLEVVLSPDGERVALNIAHRIWVLDIQRGTMVPLDGTSERLSVRQWSKEGTEIVYAENAETGPRRLLSVLADGSRPARPLEVVDARDLLDGSNAYRLVSYDRRSVRADNDVVVVAVHDGAGATVDLSGMPPFLGTPDREERPWISRDGRLLAYVSNRTGANEVYVTSLGGRGGHLRVSQAGGQRPRWAEGRLFFVTPGNELVRVAIGGDREPELGEPETVLAGDPVGIDFASGYDVSADGRRFLVIQDVHRGRRPPRIVVMREWWVGAAQNR